MKKLLLSLISIGGIGWSIGNCQCIPDTNFQLAIAADCPTCIDLGTGCLLPPAKVILDLNVAGKNIVDVTGIEEFTSLQLFYCNNNSIATISALPDSLQLLYC